MLISTRSCNFSWSCSSFTDSVSCVEFCNGELGESTSPGLYQGFCDGNETEPHFFCAWNTGDPTTSWHFGPADTCHDYSADQADDSNNMEMEWNNPPQSHSCSDAWDWIGVCPPGCNFEPS